MMLQSPKGPSPRHGALGSPTAALSLGVSALLAPSSRLLSPRNVCLVMAALGCAALAVAAAALTNVEVMRFLRVIWQGVQVFPPWDFHPSAVDPVNGHILPLNTRCRAGFRSDHYPFEQCAPELLDSTVSTVTRRIRPRQQQFQNSHGTSLSAASQGATNVTQASTILDFSACSASYRGDDNVHCPVEWVTHITSCNRHANRLARTVAAAGVPMSVIGLGTFWKKRWGYRMRLLHDHLVGVPPEKLIVVTDSEDVLPVPATSPQRIARAHSELVALYDGPRVFFAAEIVCYPRPQLWYRFPEPSQIPNGRGRSPFKCLNAGIMVGPAGLIRKMTQLAYQQDCHDDQLLFSYAAVDPFMWWADPHTGEYHVVAASLTPPDTIPAHARPLIGLDNWNILALSMYAVDDEFYQLDQAGTALNFTLTHSNPLILHQSGDKSESSLLESLARKFRYDSFGDKQMPPGGLGSNESSDSERRPLLTLMQDQQPQPQQHQVQQQLKSHPQKMQQQLKEQLLQQQQEQSQRGK